MYFLKKIKSLLSPLKSLCFTIIKTDQSKKITDQNFTKIKGIISVFSFLETKPQYLLLLSIEFTTADILSTPLQMHLKTFQGKRLHVAICSQM